MSEKNTLFYAQLSISVIGLIFTGTMTILSPDKAAVYFPIFTSLIFAWIPTPITAGSPKDTPIVLPINKQEIV